MGDWGDIFFKRNERRYQDSLAALNEAKAAEAAAEAEAMNRPASEYLQSQLQRLVPGYAMQRLEGEVAPSMVSEIRGTLPTRAPLRPISTGQAQLLLGNELRGNPLAKAAQERETDAAMSTWVDKTFPVLPPESRNAIKIAVKNKDEKTIGILAKQYPEFANMLPPEIKQGAPGTQFVPFSATGEQSGIPYTVPFKPADETQKDVKPYIKAGDKTPTYFRSNQIPPPGYLPWSKEPKLGMTEAELTARANAGDKDAKAVLDSMADRKVDITNRTGMTEAYLTKKALDGDEDAKKVLDQMQARRVEIAKQTGIAGIEVKLGSIDIDGTARAIVEGRENIENVKNTFGLPVQEAVRKRVLAMSPDFNFQVPRANIKALQASLGQQQKVRGMMGSFVTNINKQLDRIDTIMKDVISRVGVRGIDLPIRELNTRFVGSGHEKALEAYLIEISNEIGKLSTGSAASIRELSTDAQERWAKIHDPNLSFGELKKILDETRMMGSMRLQSTDEELNRTMGLIQQNPQPGEESAPPGNKRFLILKVE